MASPMRPHTHVVNSPNCGICGCENPHVPVEHVCDSPNINVRCGVTSDRIVGPCISHESPTTCAVCLAMLENFVFPQIAAEADGFISKQDGASAHFGAIVRSTSNERFPGRRIGRGGPINRPPRISGLTLMELLGGGGVPEDSVHSEGVEFLICAEGLQRLSLQCLWMCSLGCGVKWNVFSTSVRLSVLFTMNCTT
jgi:hypothetical protein